MSNRRRVVVTGLGLVAPVGNTVAVAWDSIQAGRSGIQPITHFDKSAFSVRFGGAINGFDITEYMSAKDARKMDPFIHYGMAAGIQAIRDSGLEVTEKNAPRIGVAIGAGIGGIYTIEQNYEAFLEQGSAQDFAVLRAARPSSTWRRAICRSCTASRVPTSPSCRRAVPAHTISPTRCV